MRYKNWPVRPLLGLMVCATLAPCANDAGDRAMAKRCAEWAKETAKEMGKGYNVLSAPPFVLAGDLSRQSLVRWRDHTIQPAAGALWKQFFDQRPKEPIRILLLSNEKAYRRTAKAMFGDTDVSCFGYFRTSDMTMIMNIATGGGTLVHEVTHALMEPDFPECPVWFSEGMGALFEQCSLAGGRIRGLVNWRYPHVRKAIDGDALIPLGKLFPKTRADFDGKECGLLYAESRYLVFYLQERGVLERYYEAFRDGHEDDPTGSATLVRVTGKELEDLQKDWVKWAKTLRWE